MQQLVVKPEQRLYSATCVACMQRQRAGRGNGKAAGHGLHHFGCTTNDILAQAAESYMLRRGLLCKITAAAAAAATQEDTHLAGCGSPC